MDSAPPPPVATKAPPASLATAEASFWGSGFEGLSRVSFRGLVLYLFTGCFKTGRLYGLAWVSHDEVLRPNRTGLQRTSGFFFGCQRGACVSFVNRKGVGSAADICRMHEPFCGLAVQGFQFLPGIWHVSVIRFPKKLRPYGEHRGALGRGGACRAVMIAC